MTIRIIFILLSFTITISAQQTSYDEFSQLADQWKQAYNSKDAKNFLPLYAEHTVYISAHVPGYEANGRENVIANFQKGMNQGGHIDSVRILSVNVSCDLASVVTRYDANNSGVTVNGRNILIAKNIGGSWKIITHMTVTKD